LEILLHALAGLRIPYRLRIAGTGKVAYISKLKRLISTLNIADKVEWVGWKSYEEKFSFLAASDLFALTSHNENFAIVVIESLHAGTPVLISKHVGLSDYVHQHKLGWVTSIDRVEQVQAKITEAYYNHEERARISREARTIILGDFNDVTLAGEYLELYEKCKRGFAVRHNPASV